jgi:carbon-monoxide dehydrogenase large subunit
MATALKDLPLPSGGFGQAVRRTEDKRFITGRGRYVDDVTLPGQTYAAFVRSPHAHARITGIDAAEALASPGVLAVYTGADIAKAGLGPLICGWFIQNIDGTPMRIGHHPILALDRVRYVGDHVAIVIAETRAQARDAADLVAVDYDDLPVVADLAAAQAPEAVQLHENAPQNTAFFWELGNKTEVETAFSTAAHRVSLTLRNNRLVPNAMEPRAVNASYDAGTDDLTLYLTSQNPHGIRGLLSAVIGLGPEHKIRIISPDVGGGFGSKAFNYAEECAVAWAAKQLGRPVKWTGERSEAFLSDAHGRDHLTTAELALDSDLRITGLRVRTIANLGGYVSTFGTLVPTYMYATLLSGQYAIPAIHAHVEGVYTNTAPLDAYRGAGRPEAAYVIERIIDQAARQLKADPAELRKRNFIQSFPYQTPVVMEYDSGDYAAAMDRARDLIDAAGFPARRAAAEARGLKRGLGYSAYVEACGIGPSQLLGKLGGASGMWESAEVRVNPSGTVQVLSGSHSHGQGHATTFAQLVASRFGIPFESIQVVQGDTGQVQVGMGTFGSRSGPVGMSAVHRACETVIAKAKTIAGYVLEVPLDTVEFRDGLFSSAETNQTLTFAEVAGAAHSAQKFPLDKIEPGLNASSFFDPPNFTYPSGVYACEVEIDPATGITRIVRFVAVDDFGVIANPMIVEGQVHGGLAQGIGQALLENCVYDPQSGQLLSGSFMDYCMPRADDLPAFEVETQCTPTPSNPLGMKGCGEAGAIGAPPAVINAITDALDIDDIAMPATPERVWRAANGL